MALSEGEWKVMNALWARHPATAREIFDALPPGTDWAYTTLKTILARMVEKGVLAERKQGHRSLYEPLVTRMQARRSAVRSLLDRAFDGAFGSLFHYLVDEERLSPEQRRELRGLLENRPGPRGSRRRGGRRGGRGSERRS